MKEYLERGTNLEVNQVEAQEQEEYLSLSLSPSLLPQSRLSLSLSLSLGSYMSCCFVACYSIRHQVPSSYYVLVLLLGL